MIGAIIKRAVVSMHQVIFATTLLIIAALCAAPPVQAQTFTYVHTDALGSPVAKTNASKAVVSITRYEPYELTWAGNAPTIGFTGHVNDADTGLTYMQQRYYDPLAGRLLSIDPVTTDANTGGSFNRYAYANNGPYKYIDPDGRDPERAYGAAVALLNLTPAQQEIWMGGERAATTEGAGAIQGFAMMQGVQAAVTAPNLSVSTIAVRVVTPIASTKVDSKNGPRAGKDHTQAAKRNSLDENKKANGGQATCPECGGKMSDPKQSQSGVPKDMTQAEGDHIVAKANGGNGATAKDSSNIRTICAQCNNDKSDK